VSEHIDKVMQAVESLNGGDVDTLYERVADGCVLTGPTGELMRGRDAILEGDRGILLQLERHWRRLIRGPAGTGSSFAFWVEFGGTVKATGKTFETEVCNVMHLDTTGKIDRWEAYHDVSRVIDAWVPDS
jgi:hypothetical protein